MNLPIRACPATNTAGVDMLGRWLVIDTPELRGRERSETRSVRLRNRHIRDDGSIDDAGVAILDRALRHAGVIRTGEWKRSPTVRDYWVAPVRPAPPASETPPAGKSCPKGHPYTPENTGWSSDRRRCHTCRRAAGARKRARKARCRQGHPLDDGNVIITGGKRPRRNCLICFRARQDARKASRRG